MRANKVLWLEALKQHKVDLIFGSDGNVYCEGTECKHKGEKKKFATVAKYFTHLLKQRLLPCLGCPHMDLKWKALHEKLANIPKDSKDAQILVTKYEAHVDTHLIPKPQEETLATRNGCFSVGAKFTSISI